VIKNRKGKKLARSFSKHVRIEVDPREENIEMEKVMKNLVA